MRYLSVCSGIEAASVAWHPNSRNLTNMKVGRLTVISLYGRTADKHLAWLCQCECGKTKVISSNSLTKKNPVQSCGCMNKDTASRRLGSSWNEGKSYSINSGEHCYKTRHGWAKAIVRHYGNKCERCGWEMGRCDAHHRIPKSKNGLHTIDNGIVLCPNCHRIEHENRVVES